MEKMNVDEEIEVRLGEESSIEGARSRKVQI